MSAQNGTAGNIAEPIAEGKGKGKAVLPTEDVSMETGEDSSSEEELEEGAPVEDEADDDNMEEIDRANIIAGGRRTRGKNIDFAKAAQELPEEDEDEDEDDDFEAPEDDEDDKMQE